jgi:hypothetical protein
MDNPNKYKSQLNVRDIFNTDATNPIAFEHWKCEIKENQVEVLEYNTVCVGPSSHVLGKCSEALENMLPSHHFYPAVDQEGIALPTIIKHYYTLFGTKKLADALAEV